VLFLAGSVDAGTVPTQPMQERVIELDQAWQAISSRLRTVMERDVGELNALLAGTRRSSFLGQGSRFHKTNCHPELSLSSAAKDLLSSEQDPSVAALLRMTNHCLTILAVVTICPT